MYLILMVYACLISCSLINKSKCHSLAYFNLRWTCVVILHKLIYLHFLCCMQLVVIALSRIILDNFNTFFLTLVKHILLVNPHT